MKIVIYDDDLRFLNLLQNTIDIINNKRGYIFDALVYFSEKNDVIDYIEKNKEYQTVFLLDIMADDLTVGYELAEYIKEVAPNNPIIFISDYMEDFMTNVSQKINSFTFIEKASANLFIELEEVLLTAHAQIARKIFVGEEKNNIKPIKYEDILYFEKVKSTQYTNLVYKNGALFIKETLKSIKSKLDGNGIFAYSTKEFIVNVKEIKHIDKKKQMVLMTNGDYIPFSPTRKKGLIKCLSQL